MAPWRKCPLCGVMERGPHALANHLHYHCPHGARGKALYRCPCGFNPLRDGLLADHIAAIGIGYKGRWEQHVVLAAMKKQG